MDGSQIAILVVILVVVILAVSSNRRGRSRVGDGGASPWWTLGLFTLASRDDEEAREARDDARLAGDDGTMNASGSPDDRDDDAGVDDGGGDGDGDGGDGDGGDGDGGSDD